MDIHQSVWKKFWHGLTEWNVGAESSGSDWVDETGDKRVRRKTCGAVKSCERLIFLSEPLYQLGDDSHLYRW